MEKWELKYRPQSFDEVVGQTVNAKILQSTLSDPYSTMIFQGSSGCGKTTCARIYGQMLNANIMEIDAASNNGVDNMREILEIVRLQPLSNKFRVVIVDEAHMLSNGAWNSALKAIEEPNSSTIWIFCTTEFNKVPTTIRGRATTFKFYPVKEEVLIGRMKYILEKEKQTLNDQVLALIASSSHGQVRDAVKNLQQCVYAGVETEDQFNKLFGIPDTNGMRAYIESTLTNSPANGLKVINKLDVDLFDWKCRLEELLQDMMFDVFGVKELKTKDPQLADKLRELAKNFNPRVFGLFLDKLARITDARDTKTRLITLCLTGVD